MRASRRGPAAALALAASCALFALAFRSPALTHRLSNRLDRFLAATLDGPLPDGRYLYAAREGALYVYDIAAGHRLAATLLQLPIHYPRGIAAHAATGRLWVAHHGRPFPTPQNPRGQILCLDLRTHRVLWNRTYVPGIDSVQVTPDGQRLYFGYGESGSRGGWIVINAQTGDEITHLPFVPGTHNLIIPHAGGRAYLTSLKHRMLALLDTSTNTVEREVGPFAAGIRPITVNRAQTLFFATVDLLSGFQVADLATGKVIHSVQVRGFPWVDPQPPATQSHGIALSPDESQVWIVDGHNRMVHGFDVRGLPASPPRQFASVDVRDPLDPENLPKWLNFSRDGAWLNVSTGHVIDTKTRSAALKFRSTRYFLEVEWRGGRPLHAYSRYGLGYAGLADPRAE